MGCIGHIVCMCQLWHGGRVASAAKHGWVRPNGVPGRVVGGRGCTVEVQWSVVVSGGW